MRWYEIRLPGVGCNFRLPYAGLELRRVLRQRPVASKYNGGQRPTAEYRP